MRIPKLLREPLFHFVLLGAVIFAVSALISEKSERPDQIVITQGKIENIATTFTRKWQRPPTDTEFNGLLRDYVREEVAYREALAMGLDRDDTIIRRRLQQKLEFVSEDIAARLKPADADLEAFLKAHPEKFTTESTFTFEHVYLNSQKRGANVRGDADQMLQQLRQYGSSKSVPGDSTLLEPEYQNVSATEVKNIFGEQFLQHLAGLSSGEWQGPVSSEYGLHLVFVSKRVKGGTPPLNQVRDAVRREWINSARVEANEKFYEALLQRYTITIEPAPDPKVAQVR